MSKKSLCRPPRLLPEILQALLVLKERGGSNCAEIAKYIKIFLNNERCLTDLQIRRNLKQAEMQGIIHQQGGKYKFHILRSRRPKPIKERRPSSNHRKQSIQTVLIRSESSSGKNSTTLSRVALKEAKSSKKTPPKGHKKRHTKDQAEKSNEFQESQERDNVEDSDDSRIIGYYECENPKCGCKLKIIEIPNSETDLK